MRINCPEELKQQQVQVTVVVRVGMYNIQCTYCLDMLSVDTDALGVHVSQHLPVSKHTNE